jgi:YhcH/YjgK/YiaL family protein
LIIDSIANASLYSPLNDLFAAAFRALESQQLLHAEVGRYALQDADLFALVQRYITKPTSEGRWEAHNRHIDLQFIVAGTEVMGHAPRSSLAITEPYDQEKDILFLAGQGNLFTIPAGSFAIFFPHDAHMPMLSPGSPSQVHKIVIKIRADAISLPVIPR